MNQQQTANPAGKTTQTVAALLQRALSLHQAGDLNEAQHLYAKILRLEPEHVDSLHLGGLVAYKRGQYQHAQQRLLAALRINWAAPAIHVALGNAYREHGAFEQAMACYLEALKLDINNSDACLNLGIAYQSAAGRGRRLQTDLIQPPGITS